MNKEKGKSFVNNLGLDYWGLLKLSRRTLGNNCMMSPLSSFENSGIKVICFFKQFFPYEILDHRWWSVWVKQNILCELLWYTGMQMGKQINCNVRQCGISIISELDLFSVNRLAHSACTFLNSMQIAKQKSSQPSLGTFPFSHLCRLTTINIWVTTPDKVDSL